MSWRRPAGRLRGLTAAVAGKPGWEVCGPAPLVLPRILQALDGHIYRCTDYVRYCAALRKVILADPKLMR